MSVPFDWRIRSAQPRSLSALPCRGLRRNTSRALLVASLTVGAACVSCSVAGSGPAATPSVSVQPNSAQVFLGGKMHFQAAVQNASSSAVTWAVQPSDGGPQDPGSIDASGNYVAPAAPPSPVSVKVTAVLQSDPTVSGAASVSIQSSLAISPARASLTLTQSLQFQVLSAGVSASDVTWTADGGTISQAGSYTNPGVAGTYAITARLNANPGVAGQATVYVTEFTGTLTWRNDNQRSGVNSHELALSPSTVNSATFGKLFSCPVDGYVYAQPLYVANLAIAGGTHNVVFVATENDSVYAFDADAIPCRVLWQKSLIPPQWQVVQSANLLGTPNPVIGPSIGITGSPVIDPQTSFLYVVAESQTDSQTVPCGANYYYYCHRLYALDLAGGGLATVQPNPAPILTVAGKTSTFSPALENQRPALLLDNGTVYIAFGSYNVPGDYLGWLFAYDSTSLQQTGEFTVTTNPGGGGIWQSGGGPSADFAHDVFMVTGDGKFDAYRRGGSSYSDSFLRFAPSSGLSVFRYVTPCDQAADESSGNDVGASAPLLLPDAAGFPHLLVGGSKGGSLYVVNRDSNDYFSLGGCPDLASVVQTIPPPKGANQPILSTPIYWNGAIYVAPGNGNLISYPLSQGIVSPSPSASRSGETFGPQGATPAISANGTGDAVLWLIDSSGALATPNGAAILRAYDPGDLSNELYDSGMAPGKRDTAGLAVKFTVPTVANGKVYVGTQSELDVYGLLP
jgi:hypothetical protein